MSRCFPFPPPGYEKKARSDNNLDLLSKEKQKEKKHKKEKRDKEKRESKERKDKDRSKDKHKEKKERKEKHKDKKKDKERDKEKSRTSENRRIESLSEGHLEDRIRDGSIQKAEEIKDSKFTEELGRRIRDEEKGAANRMVDNSTTSTRGTIECMVASIAMEKDMVTDTINEMVPNLIGAVQGRNNGMGRPVENLASSSQRRTEGIGTATPMEKQRGTSSEKVPNLPFVEQRRNHVAARPIEKFSSSIQRTDGMCTTSAMSKERVTDNNMVPNSIGASQRKNEGLRRPVEDPSSSIKRNEGMGTASEMDEERGKGKEMVSNLVSTEQRKNDEMGRLVEKGTDKRIEGKEKTKDRKADDGKGDRHKDRDRTEKKSKTKDKDRHKQKEKEKEKMREKGEHKEQVIPRDSENKDRVDSLNIKPLAPHKDKVKNVDADGNTKKRKDFEMNGFLHEDEPRPNKLLRTTTSSLPPLENGRTLQFSHIASPCSSITHGAMNNNTKVEKALDNKGNRMINGIIAEAQPSSVELRPPFAIDASENGVVSSRAPHPDSKYLSLIYSVPKMEGLPENDDQEWLFNSNELRTNTKLEADVAPPQVWAEALHIDWADVFALPYVIPF